MRQLASIHIVYRSYASLVHVESQMRYVCLRMFDCPSHGYAFQCDTAPAGTGTTTHRTCMVVYIHHIHCIYIPGREWSGIAFMGKTAEHEWLADVR